jgi:hypothetical protein
VVRVLDTSISALRFSARSPSTLLLIKLVFTTLARRLNRLPLSMNIAIVPDPLSASLCGFVHTTNLQSFVPHPILNAMPWNTGCAVNFPV